MFEFFGLLHNFPYFQRYLKFYLLFTFHNKHDQSINQLSKCLILSTDSKAHHLVHKA